jgi:hypothetical protein
MNADSDNLLDDDEYDSESNEQVSGSKRRRKK